MIVTLACILSAVVQQGGYLAYAIPPCLDDPPSDFPCRPRTPAPTSTTTTTTTTTTIAPIPTGLFYPYGTSNGDTTAPVNDDGSTTAISISSFPFYGTSYSSLYVNTNGALTFNSAFSTYTPAPFPYSTKMIAPYWSDVDTMRNNGRVYYRSTTDSSILNRANQDVTSKCLSSFSARSVFIATWDRVTFYGGSTTTPTNTFQAVLITNGTLSFVIFNYGPITWTTGTASGGSADYGLGGTQAQVGFNADSSHYYSLPQSLTPCIVAVGGMTNCNRLGRQMFRVDQSIASPCSTLSSSLPGISGRVSGPAAKPAAV